MQCHRLEPRLRLVTVWPPSARSVRPKRRRVDWDGLIVLLLMFTSVAASVAALRSAVPIHRMARRAPSPRVTMEALAPRSAPAPPRAGNGERNL